MPQALVIRAPGTNCDTEMVRAFTLAGCARCDLVHLDRLIAEPAAIEKYDLIGFPGGFSYGDDVASGRVFAMRLRERLYAPLQAAVDRGVCIIGACNGFQVLVQVGLLPGKSVGQASSLPSSPPPLSVALTDNIGNRFIDQWLRVEPINSSPCIWTRGLAAMVREAEAVLCAVPKERGKDGRMTQTAAGEMMMLPIAHGEGRFVTASPAVLQSLESSGQIALRYTDNVNGSQNAIAGICDPTGRVFGLMPHPERYLSWNHHPFFSALPPDAARGDTPGITIFRNAVEAVTPAAAVSRR